MMTTRRKDDHSRIPMANLIQESFDKHYCCCKDKDILVAGGIDWDSVESLQTLATACSKAETAWQICRDNGKLMVAEVKTIYKESIQTRGRLARLIRNSEVLNRSGRKLSSYYKKRKIAEVIQDLHELVFIAGKIDKENPGSIPQKFIDEGKKRFESLRKKSIESELFKDEIKILTFDRKKTAAELKNVLVEVMKRCRDILIDDPERACRYTFSYYRTLNKKRSKKPSKKGLLSGICG